ncbi:hypothetical protein LZC95_48710 [Pendulispora brunnea]|uniref:Uncharacterized protein n=1 Tax=Pendulispora brunnea TaxID=2905690 RepID=A0ABZ2K6L1_9BACT
MNSLRNLPIVLEYEEDGSIHAHCPLLAGCECKAPTRAIALNTMEQTIRRMRNEHAFGSMKAHKYEVIHLALTPIATGRRPQVSSGRRRASPPDATPPAEDS